MNILESKLSHNEILSKTGIQMSKRQLSQARMGREPALSDAKALLANADKNMLEIAEREARDIEFAAVIIDYARELLSMKPLTAESAIGFKDDFVLVKDVRIRPEYADKYRKYIDLKVMYNKKAITPRNHSELIALHQQVRKQHEEAKKLSEMSELVPV